MGEIDRMIFREQLCITLQNNYVALLGQQGSGIETIINTLVNKKTPLLGMKFIAIALPRNIDDKNEFDELFLARLLDAIERVPPEGSLAGNIVQTLQQPQNITRSTNYRIHVALDALGKGTTITHIVIILHALSEVSPWPLKNLLTMLREYHDQRDNQGEAGYKLRFLVAGDVRLWRLCYHKTPDLSPFNIAQRIFLDGLSHEELQQMDIHKRFDVAITLRDLTGGVPSLVQEVLQTTEHPDDLSGCFCHLQDAWNMLPTQSQEMLKNVAEAPEQLPLCQPDYKCPHIPAIQSPWQEGFWAGFLQMRYRQLAWRSQVHQAFVLQYIDQQEAPSKFVVSRVDLQDRSQRLQKALHNKSYRRSKDEPFEEAQSLAVQTYSAELVSIIEMVLHGETNDTILSKLAQLSKNSQREWVQELGQQAIQHKEAFNKFLLETILTRTTHFLSAQFDVFLCHNDDDKEEIREIARGLKNYQLSPWLDEWEVPPGTPWLRLIEQQITQVKSAAVFVGKNGIGPWQREQIEALLREFVDRGCAVIPILLSDAPEDVSLPLFLKIRRWVDFRKNNPDPMKQLIWGITGQVVGKQ